MFGKNKVAAKNKAAAQAPVDDGNKKYLGFGALLILMNHNPEESMAMKAPRGDIATMLKSSWDIVDRESALSTIDWALNEGHRARFGEAFVRFKEGDASAIPSQNAKEFSRFLEVVRNWKLNQEDAANCRTLLAWDLERAAFLARTCQHVGYITEPEAWDILIHRVCPVAKQSFSTWGQYGMSFVEGRTFCYGGNCCDGTLALLRLTVDKNKKGKQSIWFRYPLESL